MAAQARLARRPNTVTVSVPLVLSDVADPTAPAAPLVTAQAAGPPS
jgi:hypothetical protein